VWVTPIDRALQWAVDWGDTILGPKGTPIEDIEIFGANTTFATHTYLTTGAASIVAYVLDKDSAPNSLGTPSAGYSLTVDPPTPNPGGPYEINAGDSLTVSGTSAGTPTGYSWTIGTGKYTTSSVTVDWNTLEALGINDTGSYTLDFSVSYTAFDSSKAVSTVTVPVTLKVDGVKPTIGS